MSSERARLAAKLKERLAELAVVSKEIQPLEEMLQDPQPVQLQMCGLSRKRKLSVLRPLSNKEYLPGILLREISENGLVACLNR